MNIKKHDGFIDVCCDCPSMNELEIDVALRACLPGKGYNLSDAPVDRVGNPGPGIIFRYKLMEELTNGSAWISR